jgi:hypothetical protein
MTRMSWIGSAIMVALGLVASVPDAPARDQ